MSSDAPVSVSQCCVPLIRSVVICVGNITIEYIYSISFIECEREEKLCLVNKPGTKAKTELPITGRPVITSDLARQWKKSITH